MRRGLAANRLIVSAHLMLNDAVVITDNDGIVVSFNPLSDLPAEPANSYFFNGIITPFSVEAIDENLKDFASLCQWLLKKAAENMAEIKIGEKANFYLYNITANGKTTVRTLT